MLKHRSKLLRIDENHSESVQATIEYILLLSIVVGFFLIVRSGLNRINVASSLTAPIHGDFKAAYQFGHPKACFDENTGEAGWHPRAARGGGGCARGNTAEAGDRNFRIFINPGRT
jgi:hypothetical protein